MSVVALSGGVLTRAQAQSAPLALEAYSASPAVEMMELSPSGDLLALIAVVGETRAIAVTNMTTGELVFKATVGEIKVRDLRWIGEGRVLVITSQSRSIPALGVPLSELYFGRSSILRKRGWFRFWTGRRMSWRCFTASLPFAGRKAGRRCLRAGSIWPPVRSTCIRST
ncbi:MULTISPECIES: hypothetical protein [unclassified Brevundimonas]|uniref:hypothetical protein n=1 Tax=unclassified Brevundimonas TaxID=2622653 RepID=UPI0025BF1103|nr:MULTISPECIES: hypothetical protein [unclassified Brevundimonas]